MKKMYNTLNRPLKYFYKIKFTDNSWVRSSVEIFYKIDFNTLSIYSTVYYIKFHFYFYNIVKGVGYNFILIDESNLLL